MKTTLSKLNKSQKIYVFNEDEKTKYTSYIKKADGNALYIYTPFNWQSRNKLKTLRLKEGDRISVQLPASEQLLHFTSSVLSGTTTHCALVKISLPEHLDEIEMRKFSRLNKLLKIQYSRLPGPGENYVFKMAETLNLSAGGMKLKVPESIEPGTQLILQFILPMENNYSKFRVLALVRRSDRVHNSGEPAMFHLGVEFSNIRKSELDIILNFTNTKKYLNNLITMLTQKPDKK